MMLSGVYIKMPKRKWKHIGFPEEMTKYIEKLIEDPYVKQIYGFQSIPEFLRAAANKLIKEIEENPKITKEIEITPELHEKIESFIKNGAHPTINSFINYALIEKLKEIEENTKITKEIEISPELYDKIESIIKTGKFPLIVPSKEMENVLLILKKYKKTENQK